MTQWVYGFGDGAADGSADMKDLLGGKGANLAEMANLGLPVPPGFTITTGVCAYYYDNDKTYPDALKSQMADALGIIETGLGRKLGGPKKPLLVSVRSGARASMPGMMDTILNLGLNDVTVETLATESGDPRFAYDSYRRFITMFSDVVLGVDHGEFEEILDNYKVDRGFLLDTELAADDWKRLIPMYKQRVKDVCDAPFPQDVRKQLDGAIGAVFGSWMNSRAITYRRLHDIPTDWGTAVNVQAMVFGNMGEDCATGVCFSRNPSTGENAFYGEYLINAQGEDVVAGIRTPQTLTIREREESGSDLLSMEETMPETFKELCDIRTRLEAHYKDMQDMEFTIQQGRLWMLQTRNGKRTAKAALKIGCDMVEEGYLTKREAVMRLDPAQLDQLLHPMLDPNADMTVIGRGLPASPGAATGAVVFTAEDAEAWVADGGICILVRTETSPEDIGGMHVSEGILTTRGGMTSHAAVVARGMGTPCVSGAGDMRVDVSGKTLTCMGRTFGEGDVLTIDGSTGKIMEGEVDMILPELTGDFGTLMEWVDEFRTMGVRANAETPGDAETARKFGAEGIGLCRTEHMFFEPERIIHMREMILSADETARRSALDKLLPYQRDDFAGLFRIMAGQPITIRLLDPPLNEFLPHADSDLEDVATAAGVTLKEIKSRKTQLDEANPMLGHRGCRLGITYPEVYEMQARAIFEAVVRVRADGIDVKPEIMIPLVGMRSELDAMADVVRAIATAVMKETGTTFEFLVGTMIELPRACLQAGDIAGSAEFFSFGTNDLTQTTFGFSRDDATPFMDIYHRKGIMETDPFMTIDTDGVGALVEIAVENGRKTRPEIKLGICGEHGGDPASVHFCQTVGLDYVSCSPYRVPIARLAAAQAALTQQTQAGDRKR